MLQAYLGGCGKERDRAPTTVFLKLRILKGFKSFVLKLRILKELQINFHKYGFSGT